jgi:putative restriction endonuclease
MDEIVAQLPVNHRKAMEWFSKNAGTVVSWPGKMPGGTLLVTKAKGIYKPEWSEYALSIRQNLNSPYKNKDIQHLAGQSWQYKYCPEMIDGREMEGNYTNKALLKNMHDKVPIGIPIQVQPKPNSRYKVLGLGLVKEWQDGFFVIESLIESG